MPVLVAIGVDPAPLVPEAGGYVVGPRLIRMWERQHIEAVTGELICEPDGIADALVSGDLGLDGIGADTLCLISRHHHDDALALAVAGEPEHGVVVDGRAVLSDAAVINEDLRLHSGEWERTGADI